MAEEIKPLVESCLKRRVDTVTRLHGDASNRLYYRVSTQEKSWVVMQLPAGKVSVSEEITNLPQPPSELPYVNVGRFLKKQGIPVPEIYSQDLKKGILILEDCGDRSLAKVVEGASASEKLALYQKAVALLIRLQECTPPRGETCVAFQRSFDETLFNWEFNHFLEYGIEARHDTRLAEEDRRTFVREARLITSALTQLPQVFVHRDFQSRNLMIQGDTLRLLDFQDALLGPYLYDLVALLRDSYVRLEAAEVDSLIGYYLTNRPVADPAFFRKMFDWLTIQRKLKDAGRFVYIDRVKGNSSFLPYIPTSLAYVREALERQGELKPLLDLLKKYVPEFR